MNLDPTATVDASALVAASAVVGARSIVGPFVYVGENVTIGSGCVIMAGAVLGALPFAKSRPEASIEGLHGIEILDDCRVGHNTVVQYGIERPTQIGAKSWINNLCNIGHDVVLGEGVMVGLSSSISGHSTIGDSVRIGPGCTLTNRSVVGAKATVGIGSLVLHEVPAAQTVLGRPAVERDEHLTAERELRRLVGSDRRSRPITKGSKGFRSTKLGRALVAFVKALRG